MGEAQKVLDQATLYQLLYEISGEFIDLAAHHFDETATHALTKIMHILEVDRITLCVYDPGYGHLETKCAMAVAPLEAFPANVVCNDYLLHHLQQGEELILHKDSSANWFVADNKAYLKAMHLSVHSVAMLPLSYRGALMGSLCFGTANHPLNLEECKLDFMRKVSEMFAKALDRKLRDESLEAAYAEISLLKRRLKNENIVLREELAQARSGMALVGKSPCMRKLMEAIVTVAQTGASVLIVGETGTGKELVAREIHNQSLRRSKRLVVVNCGAIPNSLFESEFFGRRKGAYTGADDSMPGKFELADASTLFLDEVAELPLDAQAKLLRVLQEGEFERLGSDKPVRVDVRIVAATNRDLKAMMAGKQFRQDLYFRLNVFPLHVPPLRDRREDIPDLVWHFVRGFEKEFAKIISHIRPKDMLRLQNAPWPGNIRELKNVLARCVILTTGDTLTVDLPQLEEDILHEAAVSPALRQTADGEALLENVERAHILRVLEHCGWKVSGKGNAADKLGLNRSTLVSRMKKLEIERPRVF